MKTVEEKIAVMQAFLDGKTIQVNSGLGWTDVELTPPNFQWGSYDYQVKPEPPKPREIYVNEYTDTRPHLGYPHYSNSLEAAQAYLGTTSGKTIKFREVIE